VNQVIVDAANAITSSFSGRASLVLSRHDSPSKLIEDHSKLYKQLLELHSLKSANVLSETEYQAEKETVVELHKKTKKDTTSC